MPRFVPGRELARALYEGSLALALRDVAHAAAFLGTGSDVLGYDDARSSDHGFGPRLQVFVALEDVPRARDLVERALPDEVLGWPTRFGWDDVPVAHHVEVSSLPDWFRGRLGFDPLAGPIEARDWLSTPQQLLLEVTEGAVLHDADGALGRARQALGWYPDDVWLWLLACQWRRIDQEEPFVGRAAEAGDDLGSRVVAARLVRDLVRLGFLLERRYAPYSKWLGTAFARLDASAVLAGPMRDALGAVDIATREDALVRCLQAAAAAHNRLGVTRRVDETIRFFHDRPYRVLGAGRFVEACRERVTDPWLRSLPLVGAVDQVADSVDVLAHPERMAGFRGLYDAWSGSGGA